MQCDQQNGNTRKDDEARTSLLIGLGLIGSLSLVSVPPAFAVTQSTVTTGSETPGMSAMMASGIGADHRVIDHMDGRTYCMLEPIG
jgi:hypothetical protein